MHAEHDESRFFYQNKTRVLKNKARKDIVMTNLEKLDVHTSLVFLSCREFEENM